MGHGLFYKLVWVGVVASVGAIIAPPILAAYAAIRQTRDQVAQGGNGWAGIDALLASHPGAFITGVLVFLGILYMLAHNQEQRRRDDHAEKRRQNRNGWF